MKLQIITLLKNRIHMGTIGIFNFLVIFHPLGEPAELMTCVIKGLQ